MAYRVSNDAERDLTEIFVYWATRASVDVAECLIDAITERFWVPGEYPGAGHTATDIAPGVSCFPAGQYLICYRKTRKGVDILHVFHGACNQKRAWKR